MNFSDHLGQFVNALQAPNILLLGAAGAGKSTLINAIFGREVAATGVALGGVTPTYKRYSSPGGIPLNLYDSAGFYVGTEDKWKKETFAFLDQQLKRGKEEQIHVAWYLFSTPTARIAPFEFEIISRLNKEGIPVIIVLSQWDIAKRQQQEGMLQLVRAANLAKLYATIPVAADPLRETDPTIGLEELVTETINKLPKIYADAFVAAQIVSIKAKRQVAYAYVTAAAATCFGVGFVPVPFSTAVAAYFAQKGLAVKLASLFGYEQLRKLPDILSDATKSKEARFMFIGTSLFDLFPFTFFTNTVAGALAGSYIMIVGLSLAATFEDLAKLELEGMSATEIEERMVLLFKEKFNRWRNIISLKTPSDLENYKGLFLGE